MKQSVKKGGILNSTRHLEKLQGFINIKVKSRMDTFLNWAQPLECKSGYGLNTVSELKS